MVQRVLFENAVDRSCGRPVPNAFARIQSIEPVLVEDDNKGVCMKIRTVVALGIFFWLLVPISAQNSITVTGTSRLAFPVTGVKIVFSVSAEAREIAKGAV